MQQQGNQEKVVAITPGKAGLGAVQRGQLIARLREQLRDALMQRIRVMLENVDDAFFTRTDKAENSRQQAQFFDAMREVRLKRKSVEADFVAGVLKNFERSVMPGAKYRTESPQDSVPGSELSLMETDELEERLAVDGMVTKARRLYAEDLYFVGQRLAALSSQTAPSVDEEIAIGPRTVCEAFNDAASVLEIAIQPKLVLYKLFDRYVIDELSDVYGGFNLTLREAGLLPNLNVETPKKSGAPRGSQPEARSPDGSADRGEGPALSEDESAAALQALLGAVRTQGQGGAGASGAAAGAADGAAPLSGQQLVGVLSQLQNAFDDAIASRPLTGDALKSELRQAVARGGAGATAFTPIVENTIDIVAMVFDFIFEDASVPEPFKGLIARLQIPVLKVALTDSSFLARRRHPARKLLHAMARAGVGWTPKPAGVVDELLALIERLVNRVIDEFEGDSKIFEEVLQEFEAKLEADEQQARDREKEVEEQALRREAREIGKAIASAAIDQLLDGNKIPTIVEDFLRGTWRDLLASIYVKSGGESASWKKAMNIASTLVWSLMPKEDDEARAQLLETLPKVLRALRDVMEKLNVSPEKREALFACLALEHSRLARVFRNTPSQERSPEEDASANVAPAAQENEGFLDGEANETSRMIAEGRFRGIDIEAVTPNLGHTSESIVLDEFYECAESIKEGTWFDWTDREGREQRIKLSWRSIISGKYFFVNTQGMKAVEMTVHALAAELRETRIRIVEEAPVVDRTLISAFDSLKEKNQPS